MRAPLLSVLNGQRSGLLPVAHGTCADAAEGSSLREKQGEAIKRKLSRTCAAPNLFMLVPADGFRYTRGEPRSYKRPDKVDAVTREFCAECGTHLTTRRPGLPPIVLKIGTLDDPSVYRGAQMAIFTAEGRSFHLVAEGVPTFEGLPPRARELAANLTRGPKISSAACRILRCISVFDLYIN